MKKVKVDKKELFHIIKGNKEKYSRLHDFEMKAYWQKKENELEDIRSLVMSKSKESKSFYLDPPQDHTKDYDNAIKMLEMEVDSTVVLDESEFASLVLNQWDWTGNFLKSVAGYSGYTGYSEYTGYTGLDEDIKTFTSGVS